MADLTTDEFNQKMRRSLASRGAAIADEDPTTPKHAQRMKIAKHIFENFEDSHQAVVAAFLTAFAGFDPNSAQASVDAKVDQILAMYATLGVWQA